MQPLASADTEPAVKDTAHNAATINLRIGCSPFRFMWFDRDRHARSMGLGADPCDAEPVQILRVGSVFRVVVPASLEGCKA